MLPTAANGGCPAAEGCEKEQLRKGENVDFDVEEESRRTEKKNNNTRHRQRNSGPRSPPPLPPAARPLLPHFCRRRRRRRRSSSEAIFHLIVSFDYLHIVPIPAEALPFESRGLKLSRGSLSKFQLETEKPHNQFFRVAIPSARPARETDQTPSGMSRISVLLSEEFLQEPDISDPRKLNSGHSERSVDSKLDTSG